MVDLYLTKIINLSIVDLENRVSTIWFDKETVW